MQHKDKNSRLDGRVANVSQSNLENMDTAIYKWIDEEINPFCTTNKGWRKVPIRWATAERARLSKDQKAPVDGVQDPQRTLIFPIVSIERTSITKDLNKKGAFWANLPNEKGKGAGGAYAVARRIQQDKTGNHQNAYRLRDRKQLNFKLEKQDKRVIWEYHKVPHPIYIELGYQVKIRAEYQQQMNEIVQTFISIGKNINYHCVDCSNHRYEIFVDSDFSQDNNINSMDEEERKYETTVSMRMLAAMQGEGPNQEYPQKVLVESVIEYKQPREYVVFQDDEGNFVNPYDE